jgi:hypothetical protein
LGYDDSALNHRRQTALASGPRLPGLKRVGSIGCIVIPAAVAFAFRYRSAGSKCHM